MIRLQFIYNSPDLRSGWAALRGRFFVGLRVHEMPTRTIVYVDGFNLYYGALKHTPYRWLNLQRYFEMVRSADDIQGIDYFTASVQAAGGKANRCEHRAPDA
jgi:hypothetical protein